jgi:hypothetical protein
MAAVAAPEILMGASYDLSLGLEEATAAATAGLSYTPVTNTLVTVRWAIIVWRLKN